MPTIPITLDVHKKSHEVQKVLGRQGETEIILRATIENDGAPYDMSGKTLEFCCKRPDGKYAVVAATSVSSNVYTCKLSEEVTAVAGAMPECYFLVRKSNDGNSRETTESFTMILDRSVTAGSEPGGNYSDSLEDLIGQAKDLIASWTVSLEELKRQIEAALSDAQQKYEKAEAARQETFKSSESSRDTTFKASEAAREAASKDAVDKANAATSSANKAAGDANSAASKANSAATSATEAATKANDAAGKASTATDSANKAAQAANDAKAQVDSAMETYTTITGSKVEWQVGDSGTDIPSGEWTSTVPQAMQGKYLWSRTTYTHNRGADTIAYESAYQGIDGVTTSISGLFWLYNDENGDLWVVYSDTDDPPPIALEDGEDGSKNLVYTLEYEE